MTALSFSFFFLTFLRWRQAPGAQVRHHKEQEVVRACDLLILLSLGCTSAHECRRARPWRMCAHARDFALKCIVFLFSRVFPSPSPSPCSIFVSRSCNCTRTNTDTQSLLFSFHSLEKGSGKLSTQTPSSFPSSLLTATHCAFRILRRLRACVYSIVAVAVPLLQALGPDITRSTQPPAPCFARI